MAGLLIAVLVPLALLVGAAQLGRGGRRLAPLVVIGLAWGVGVTWIVAPINERWLTAFGYLSLVTVGAPIIEEIAKSFVLPPLLGLRRAAWFVDGAVVGLAAGTGFAIRENILYLNGSDDGAGIALAVARTSSTNLMHAGCTALVGAAIATAARRGALARVIAWLGSLVVAIALHSAFNRMTDGSVSALAVTLVGVMVFVAAVAIIALGYPVSRRWSRMEMRARGLSAGEQAALVGGSAVDDVLDEFERRFGGRAAELAEQLITAQRSIGVAVHGGRAGAEDVTALQEQADQLRRDIGLFPMTWLRSHLPADPTSAGVWAALSPMIDESVPDDVADGAAPRMPGGLWAAMDRGTTDEAT